MFLSMYNIYIYKLKIDETSLIGYRLCPKFVPIWETRFIVIPGCANIGTQSETKVLVIPGCANIGTQSGTRILVYARLRQYWDTVGNQDPCLCQAAPILGHSREPGSLFMPGCANIGTQLGTRNLVYTKLRQYWDIIGTQSTKPIPMLQPQPNIGPMLGRIGNVTWVIALVYDDELNM